MLKSSNKTDVNVYTLEIEIDAKSFKDAIVKSYNKAKKQIAVPGFRKGKAPLHIIEKLYGESVFYEDALDLLFPEVVADAYKEAGITAVDSPKDVDVKTINKEEGVLLTMKVTVKPEEVSLKAYKGLEAEKKAVRITEADVTEAIDKRREQDARMVEVTDRAAANGDIATIDFEGFVDGVAFEGGKAENYELELGSGSFIPGFEEQIVDHNIGDEFAIDVKFPKDYAEELANKDATFKIKLNGIKVKELPELDDEFAKDLDYDTVDDLKAGTKKELREQRKAEYERMFEGKVMEALVDNLEAEIPECMFDNKAEENMNMMAQRLAQQGLDLDTYLMYMGMTKEQYKATLREQSIPQVKLELALEKVAELENLEISDAELDEEYNKLAEMYKMEADKVKAIIPAEALKTDLLNEKASKFVVDNAEAVKPAKKSAKKDAE